MRRYIAFVTAVTLTATLLVSATAYADNEPQTFFLEMESPNVAEAPNGDRVAVTGEGTFTVNPKSVEAEGRFTHTFAGGGSLSGTWNATQLLEYQSYGCGVVFGDPIDPSACGGVIKMRVTLMPLGTSLHLDGIMNVICVIGPNPPDSILGPRTEGVTLNLPGIINFNHSVGGENVYIQTG